MCRLCTQDFSCVKFIFQSIQNKTILNKYSFYFIAVMIKYIVQIWHENKVTYNPFLQLEMGLILPSRNLHQLFFRALSIPPVIQGFDLIRRIYLQRLLNLYNKRCERNKEVLRIADSFSQAVERSKMAFFIVQTYHFKIKCFKFVE